MIFRYLVAALTNKISNSRVGLLILRQDERSRLLDERARILDERNAILEDRNTILEERNILLEENAKLQKIIKERSSGLH